MAAYGRSASGLLLAAIRATFSTVKVVNRAIIDILQNSGWSKTSNLPDSSIRPQPRTPINVIPDSTHLKYREMLAHWKYKDWYKYGHTLVASFPKTSPLKPSSPLLALYP
ncbi:hypothetical protein FS842_011412 [Serendipita sp. 407]|nr:hypothetical protein FS842_011412 [Serendipita sp. 407]